MNGAFELDIGYFTGGCSAQAQDLDPKGSNNF